MPGALAAALGHRTARRLGRPAYCIDDLSADEPFLQTINDPPFATVPYTAHLNDIVSEAWIVHLPGVPATGKGRQYGKP